MKRSEQPIEWSGNLAYAVGLIVTDGSLSKDGRHIDVSSVDREQLENFLYSIGRNCKIGVKKSGAGIFCFRIQFSDVNLYKYLLNIGITPNKTKSIGSIDLPEKFFYDFLRGHFDGDGSIYSYFDLRWRSSFMFYFCFVSASENHILWIRNKLTSNLGIMGTLTKPKSSSVWQLRYAKKESLVLIRKLYYNKHVVCLSRKRKRIEAILKKANLKI